MRVQSPRSTARSNSVRSTAKSKRCDGELEERERETLTDEETLMLLRSVKVPRRLKAMAAVSRGSGGGRTSDLLALNWEHIDTAEWK